MNPITKRQSSKQNHIQSFTVISLFIFSLFITEGVGVAFAQGSEIATVSSPAASGERMFFPHGFIRGFAEFDVAPPHNEVDLGYCKDLRTPGDRCTGFARYEWRGSFEVQPFGKTILHRLYLIYAANLFQGDNIPQTRYTWSADPILWEQNLGVGVELPKGLQLRLVGHKVFALGKYTTPGVIDLSSNGPYGLNTKVGLRWNFGGRRIFEE